MPEEEATRLVAAFAIAAGLFWFSRRLERWRIKFVEKVKEKLDRLDHID